MLAICLASQQPISCKRELTAESSYNRLKIGNGVAIIGSSTVGPCKVRNELSDVEIDHGTLLSGSFYQENVNAAITRGRSKNKSSEQTANAPRPHEEAAPSTQAKQLPSHQEPSTSEKSAKLRTS